MSDYTQHERDVLAHLTMRSLRGSFFPVERRCELLKELAEDGLTYYDGEALIEKIEWHVERDYADGRTFRSVYTDWPDLAEYTDERTVRRLAQEIPDDITWSDWAINYEFEEDDE